MWTEYLGKSLSVPVLAQLLLSVSSSKSNASFFLSDSFGVAYLFLGDFRFFQKEEYFAQS